MNLPMLLLTVVIVAVFSVIVLRGISNRRHHRSGCGCDSCPNSGACHPK